MDLNSPQFNAELYVQDLLRRKGLEELVAVEQDMVNNVRRLDSEMQSLVYENYSKFLNATSTVRDVQNRLNDTQNGMRDLSTRMKHITVLSNSLTEKFSKNCETVKRLNDAKDAVKRLEFLIKVPQILQESVKNRELAKAVDTYIAFQPKIQKFGYLQSLKGIAKDTDHIIRDLKTKLHESLKGRLISAEETIESVTLLKRLGEQENELEKILLVNWEAEIGLELNQLETNSAIRDGGRFKDIFEFVDIGCCHFLTNLSLMASTFLQLFAKQTSKAELVHLLERVMGRFELIVCGRFEYEESVSECALFVKALDRIFRKISVLSRLSSGYNFLRFNAELVQRSARHQIANCRRNILNSVQKTNIDIFTNLLNSPPSLSSSQSDTGRTFRASSLFQSDRNELLKKTLETLENGFIHSVKGALAALLMFTASDIIFSTIPHFQPLFGFDVHEQIISNEKGEQATGKAVELVVLATFLRNLHLKHLEYLMELCQEQYRLSEFAAEQQTHSLTPIGDLANPLKRTVDDLLRKYVEAQSKELIQLAGRSIELFDWNGCTESPRHVRSLVKHLALSVEEMNRDLCTFMDDGGLAKLKERTPDSLRGYATMRRAASAASSVYNDASSVSSGGIVERLWGDTETPEEGVGILSAETVATMTMEFRRDVVMGAIVRLLLLAFCDFVRAQKFSRQGFEQLQVDCAYVRQRLWYFVADEHMLNTCIEDIVTAAVNQCAQPKLLDPAIVDLIVAFESVVVSIFSLSLHGENGSVQCFSFETQRRITPSMGHFIKFSELWRKRMKKAVRAVQISEDGASLYATSSNRAICLFDIETGQRVRCIREGHKSRPNAIELLPWGQRQFATGTENGEIKTWDFGQSKPNVHTFKEQEDIINSLHFWRNNLLAASGDGTLAAYDTQKGKMRVKSETMHSELLSLAVTERFTYVGAADGHIEVFNNGQFGNIRERVDTPFLMGVERIVVLRNNLLLASASTAEEMRFLHVNPNKTLCGIPRPGGVDVLAKTADGTSLITTSADGTRLNFYSTEELVKDIPALTAQDMRGFKRSQREERKRKRADEDGFFGDLLSDVETGRADESASDEEQ
uniref:Vacuolar protein sorting-associated protein 51 homolog n=1 Tax=Globodera rostochiensis TaxID=31243 RepID=A0A914GUI7_GLORO